MDMVITFTGGKRVDASYKGFTIKTDQSEFHGGDGSAPAPFDLFLASIGTCAGIFVLEFCQKRNIPTENIHLIQRTERNSKKKMISKIAIDIHLPSDFPEKYFNAIKQSVNLCSVKRHIIYAPEFDITINM